MKTKTKNKQAKKATFKRINRGDQGNLIDRQNFCGSINLKIDPMNYQRKMRNEWE